MVEVTNHDKHLRDTLIEHWDDLQEEAIDELLATHRQQAAKAGRDAGIIEGRRQAFYEAVKALEAIEIPEDGLGDKIEAWLKAIRIGATAILALMEEEKV